MAKANYIKNLNNYKTIKRESIKYRAVEERIKDFNEILSEYSEDLIKNQASRCQNCGIPFCHGFGCPLGNLIPDWNELVYNDRWEEALELLHKTNNFPEITGRLCPALCEDSCTLNVGLEPVTIRNIELAIIEKGFKNGYIKPIIPDIRTGRKIAVIGSGPAGLACAQDLNRMGHSVTLFEKDAKAGGFLRYGIPDFKLNKKIIDRRINQIEAEGVKIRTNFYVGIDITINELKNNFDAIVLCVGSREPRDLNIEGRNLAGIHFATDYLFQINKINDGYHFSEQERITAKDKEVIVIGGGDTGADCVGTARREGAKNIYQYEILPMPPEKRSSETPWPMYAKMLRTNSSHQEGCIRKWLISTKKFLGTNKIEEILACEVEWIKDDQGKWIMKEKTGTEFKQKADLVLLALGFTHPVYDKLIKDFNFVFDKMGNIATSEFGYGRTNINKVYAAGDASRGASLIVWAIYYGKMVAKMVNDDLK